jgi:hypothetical protein
MKQFRYGFFSETLISETKRREKNITKDFLGNFYMRREDRSQWRAFAVAVLN